jgi:phage terminase small subunit
MSLSHRQALFVECYIKDLNAKAAAEAAGYSKRTAKAQGSRLLQHPDVAAAIEGRRGAIKAKLEITTERVLEELAKVGFANMQDYVRIGDDGDPYVDLSQMDRDQAGAVAEVTIEDFKNGRGERSRDVRRVKFKLHDKLSALQQIGRHLGMFGKDRLELTGRDGGPIQFEGMTDLDVARRVAFLLAKAGAHQAKESEG